MLFRATSKIFSNFSSSSVLAKVTLPELKYSYSALQPVLSSKLLQLHHKKHHQTYVNNLNNALEMFKCTFLTIKEAQENCDFNKMVTMSQNIKFNLGGHVNHSIFWENLAPVGQDGGVFPDQNSNFSKHVISQFGSFDALIQTLTSKAVQMQGSGWAWLGYDNASQALAIVELPNQQMLAPLNISPLLGKNQYYSGIDVWEHAFYVDYKNQKPAYLQQIWKIVNWKHVEKRYNNAKDKNLKDKNTKNKDLFK